MDDVQFMAFAQGIVGYVDEKYGRAAAWIATAAIITLPIALIIGALWWFAS